MYSNISKNFQNKTCTILFNYSDPLSQHFHDCIVFKIIFKINMYSDIRILYLNNTRIVLYLK